LSDGELARPINLSKPKKKGCILMQPFIFCGSPTWTRTRDLRINSQIKQGGLYSNLIDLAMKFITSDNLKSPKLIGSFRKISGSFSLN